MTRKEMVALCFEQEIEKNILRGGYDIQCCTLFTDASCDSLVYVPDRKSWYYYDGKVWSEDVGSMRAMGLLKDLSEVILGYAAHLTDPEERRICYKNAMQWQRYRFREVLLRDAQSENWRSIADFDKNENLLNFDNGTLDLSTMYFYCHNPEDYLTRLAPTHYEPKATCERFTRFIQEIMQGDEKLVNYLQTAMGYGLCGANREECFFILYGATTRNGKSTLTETLQAVLGDYCAGVAPESLSLRKSSAGAPSEDIARLKGIRYAFVSEPEADMTFHAARLKALTGRDTVTARFLHQNSFEYLPQFKLYLNTNHLPRINDMTLFHSGRIHIIPFLRHFTPEEQDKGLKELFREEEARSAVLNWLIEGWKKYQSDGFYIPYDARNILRDYRKESDPVARFYNEMLIKDEGNAVPSAGVYYAYRNWCGMNGEAELSKIDFCRQLVHFVPLKQMRYQGKVRRCFVNIRVCTTCTG